MNVQLYEMFQRLGEDYRIKVLPFLPEPQRTDELMKILGKYLEEGWLYDARETANIIFQCLLEKTQYLSKEPPSIHSGGFYFRKPPERDRWYILSR